MKKLLTMGPVPDGATARSAGGLPEGAAAGRSADARRPGVAEQPARVAALLLADDSTPLRPGTKHNPRRPLLPIADNHLLARRGGLEDGR